MRTCQGPNFSPIAAVTADCLARAAAARPNCTSNNLYLSMAFLLVINFHNRPTHSLRCNRSKSPFINVTAAGVATAGTDAVQGKSGKSDVDVQVRHEMWTDTHTRLEQHP